MNSVLLTQYEGKILGPIAKILGYLLNGIFFVIEKIGIPNVGLAIILFTIVIYMVLLPLTVKQQKFSKLSSKMNPEIQAIQKKYQGKKDQESMTRLNEETQAVYKKYGVSPSGSCINLIIQMPILFALYRVIYNVPAYVNSVKQAFLPLVSEFITKSGALDFIQNKENFVSAVQFTKQFSNDAFVNGLTNGDSSYVVSTFIDVLNRASTAEWHNIYAAGNYPELKNLVESTLANVEKFNYFLGLNIANSPQYYVTDFIKNKGSIALAIGALMFPLLAAVTQWLNTKLMPQQDTQPGNDQASAMAASMKSMNIMMPLMSMVFCFSLPLGLGLYWIIGAVIRSVQQVVINKQIDKMDIDEIVKKNTEKLAKQREKNGVKADVVNNNARLSTKAMASGSSGKSSMTAQQREEAIKKSTEYYSKGVKPGSLAAKANMVKQYNEKNNKN